MLRRRHTKPLLLTDNEHRTLEEWARRHHGPASGATLARGIGLRRGPAQSKLYHEIYGEGEPLVLIHGGLTTISETQGWVQPLAQTRQVIAVEMQGDAAPPTRTGR